MPMLSASFAPMFCVEPKLSLRWIAPLDEALFRMAKPLAPNRQNCNAAGIEPRSGLPVARRSHSLDLWNCGEYNIRIAMGLFKLCAISLVFGWFFPAQKTALRLRGGC
jgi:hypothetical protein